MDRPNTATVPSFTYPTVQPTQTQVDRQRAIGLQAQTFANALAENCPPGDELNVALQTIRTTLMWGNQAIIAGGATRQAGA